MKKLKLFILGLAIFFSTSISLAGYPPQELAFEGLLTNNLDNPIANDTVKMVFRIWDDKTVGNKRWEETQDNVITDKRGLFRTSLGKLVAVPDTVLDCDSCWLEVEVDNQIISPRTKLLSGPYAFRVRSLEAARGGKVEGSITIKKPIIPFGQQGLILLGENDEDTLVAIKPVTTGKASIVLTDHSSTGMAGGAFPQAGGSIMLGPPNTLFFNVFSVTTPAGQLGMQGSYTTNIGGSIGFFRTGHLFSREGAPASLKAVEIGQQGLRLFGSTPAETLVVMAVDTLTSKGKLVIRKPGVATGERVEIGSTDSAVTVYDDDGYVRASLGLNPSGKGALRFYPSNALEKAPAMTNKVEISEDGITFFRSAVGALKTLPDETSMNLNPNNASFTFGYNNRAGDSAVVAGGYNNSADGFASFIGGGHDNGTTGSESAIQGGYWNTINGAHDAAIAGGFAHYIDTSAYASIICGGESDTVRGFTSAIVGGKGNKANGYRSFIGAGSYCVTSGNYSCIPGGIQNIAGGGSSVVAGGQSNEALGLQSTVSGGGNNKAKGEQATIAGGADNTADSNMSTVGGGRGNSAIAQSATVAGGRDNRASGEGAVVSGGAYDTANGYCATIPGGYNNIAAGQYSWAGGFYAKANHRSTFVWAESTAAGFFTSTAPNQFLIRASGHVGINVNNPSEDLDVSGTARLRNMPTGSGTTVVVDANGVLEKQSSSKRYKENISSLEIDPAQVLQLQPVRFQWKTTGQPDIGLIAEEVEQILPELVIYDKEGKPDAVKYDRLAIYLLGALKQLKTENNTLKNELSELRDLVQTIRAEQNDSKSGDEKMANNR
jgi:hypothetical protein